MQFFACPPYFFLFFFAAMIIGFSQRRVTVSESDALPDEDLFQHQIDVHSMRLSEIEYEVQFRVLNTGTADVEATNLQSSNIYDALFGVRDNPQEPLEDSRPLPIYNLELIDPLNAMIRDDFNAEDDEECFTIVILSPDLQNDRNIFTCNGDDVDATDFFCLYTICILDDDGQFYIYTSQRCHRCIYSTHLQNYVIGNSKNSTHFSFVKVLIIEHIHFLCSMMC